MKTFSLALVAAVAAMSLPVLTNSASAYQCKTGFTEAQVHKPTRLGAKVQAKKSWAYKVKNDEGLSWSVWKIAGVKSLDCEKAVQRWVCTARAKPCLYVVQ